MKLNLRSVDLNLLPVFDAIMTEGQLSKAADKLGMTQSAASAALSRLRLSFNDELFVRTRQGMVPTPKAEELIQPVREGLSKLGAAFESTKHFDPSQSSRVFKLVLGDFGEIMLLPSLISAFEKLGPHLSIQTYSDRDIKNIELAKKSQIDFFFDFRLPDDPNLDYCELLKDELVVISKKDHPNIHKRLSKKQFLAEKHLTYTHHHHHIAGLEKMFGAEQGISRKVLAEVQQVLAIPQLVCRSNGIATLPKRLAQHFSLSHDIKIYPFPFDTGEIPGYMIWHKSLNQDKAHQWLKQLLLNMHNRAT